MRRSDFILVAVLLIPGMAGMIVFIMMGGAGTGTLPSLETLKEIYIILYVIALFLTVAIMAIIFFKTKEIEFALRFGFVASVTLIAIDSLVQQIPV